MATENTILFRVGMIFIISFLSATTALTSDRYPPTKFDVNYRPHDPYYQQELIYPTAPFLEEIPISDEAVPYFLSYDPFSIVIVGREHEAGAICDANDINRRLISFTAAMAEIIPQLIFDARAQYVPVFINRASPPNFTIADPTQIAKYLRLGTTPLQITWTPAQPGTFDYQDPWYCKASLLFKPHKNSPRIHYKITNPDRCVPIAALIAEAQARHAKIEINHAAMTSERHLKYLPLEYLLRISEAPQK